MSQSPNDRVYLGDSVYASNDGYHIILCTDNGLGPQNILYIEDAVFLRLSEYAQKVWGKHVSSDHPSPGN